MDGWMDDEGGSMVIYIGCIISYIDRGGWYGIWQQQWRSFSAGIMKGRPINKENQQ